MNPSIHPSQEPHVHSLRWFFAGQAFAVACTVGAMQIFEMLHWPRLMDVTWATIPFAIPFAMASLLAAWNALGDDLPLARPDYAVLYLTGLGVICFAVPSYLKSGRGNPLALAGISLAIQWVVVQVPLWMARLSWGWRLTHGSNERGPDAHRKLQFGIKYLLIWTTIVGSALGLVRFLVTRIDGSNSDTIGFGTFVVSNSLWAWPTILGTLSQRWWAAALLGSLGTLVAVSLFEPWFLARAFGMATLPGIFYWMNGVQFVWLVVSLIILRVIGIRLVRGEGPQSAAP